MIATIKSTMTLCALLGISAIVAQGAGLTGESSVSLDMVCVIVSVAVWLNVRFTKQDKKIDALKESIDDKHEENKRAIESFIKALGK